MISENFDVSQNTLKINEPYGNMEKVMVGNNVVYILFGNVDYYKNKEAILAIKRKSSQVMLDQELYNEFLKEFHRRFYSIPELSESDLLVSIETTGPVNNEMAKNLNIPYVKDGLKKNNPLIKMKDIDLKDRSKISDLFKLNFQTDNINKVCVMDDFITTGNTFKNAFDKLNGINSVGVCLFKLDS